MPSTDTHARHVAVYRIAVGTLVLFISLLGRRDASAQSRVTGELLSADGAPIAGATVRVESPDMRSPASGTSDASGRYTIENIKPGIWAQVTAFRPNGRLLARAFTLVTQAVETVDLQAPRETGTALSADDLDPLGGPAGVLKGIVSADAAPIGGATVTIGNSLLTTTTDSAGRYAFSGLRAGIGVEVAVAAAGYNPARVEAAVPGTGGDVMKVAMVPGPAADGGRLPLFETAGDDHSIRLRPDERARVPAIDRLDVFRTLQLLPAISAGQEASSELLVRGGSPDQTRVSLDGFTVYPLAHLSGAFSALNMDAVAAAQFTPATTEAADGGSLGGALHLTGASGSSAGPGGAVDLSMLGLATTLTVPVGSRGSLLLAGRRSPPTDLYGDTLDRLYGTDTDAARARRAGFSGGLFSPPAAAPSFYDLNAKVRLQAAAHDRVSVTLYNARDIANRSHDVSVVSSDRIGVPDPTTLPADATIQVNREATWRGRGAAAEWAHSWSPAAATVVTVGRSEFSNDADSASMVVDPSTGVDYSFVAGRGGSQAVSEQNAIRDTTVRVVNSLSVGFAHAVSAGVEIASLDTTYGASTEVFQSAAGSNGFTSTLMDLLRRSDQARTTTVFGQDAWRPFARVTLTPGARVTRYDVTGTTYFDPHVSATYLVRPEVRLTGGLTLDHQFSNRIVREDLAGDDAAFWTLADGNAIPVPRARQGFIGAAVELPGVLWSAQAYYKRLDDLTMFAPRLPPGMNPGAADALLHVGSGRSVGFETIVQHAADRNSFWASLAAGRAEYTYPTLEDRTFPASWDRRAEVKIADTLRLRRVWSLSAVWVAAGGRPVTPASGTEALWFPSGEALTQIAFGSKNSTRLPAYHRLDLSGQREVRVAALKATLGATVLNVYDRENVAYTEQQVANGAVTPHDVLLLRRTVNFFVRFVF